MGWSHNVGFLGMGQRIESDLACRVISGDPSRTRQLSRLTDAALIQAGLWAAVEQWDAVELAVDLSAVPPDMFVLFTMFLL